VRWRASSQHMGCERWSPARAPRLHPRYRPNGGFLTPEQWTEALEDTGFSDVRVLPDTERILDVCPTFYVATFGANRLA
jgi:hypothetical protein